MKVKLIDASDGAYRFVEIANAVNEPAETSVLDEFTLELATKTGSSRIVQMDSGRVVVGILNQYRYWTPSRARLLAADILREYFSAFKDAR